MEKKKVLFVCMGNCVRSQMAEALAKHHFAHLMVAQSAGLRPLGFIDPTARSVVEERGVSMDGQFSKGLHEHTLGTPDLIVNMSGLRWPRMLAGENVEEWAVADPFGEDPELHRRICDDIEKKLKELAQRLAENQQSSAAAN